MDTHTSQTQSRVTSHPRPARRCGQNSQISTAGPCSVHCTKERALESGERGAGTVCAKSQDARDRLGSYLFFIRHDKRTITLDTARTGAMAHTTTQVTSHMPRLYKNRSAGLNQQNHPESHNRRGGACTSDSFAGSVASARPRRTSRDDARATAYTRACLATPPDRTVRRCVHTRDATIDQHANTTCDHAHHSAGSASERDAKPVSRRHHIAGRRDRSNT